MLTNPSNIFATIFILLGLLFVLWSYLLYRGVSWKGYALWMVLGVAAVIFLPKPISSFLGIPPITNTITLHNVNSADWDNQNTLTNLRSKSLFFFLRPPILSGKWVENKQYGLIFQIGHSEYGTYISRVDISIQLPTGLTEVPSLGWATEILNNKVVRHFSQIRGINFDERALLARTLFITAISRGAYPVTYEIKAIASDPNEHKYPTGVITGTFVVLLN